MNVQTRKDNNVTPFILHSLPAVIVQNATIFKDAGRTTVLAKYTLMAKIVATGKWVPFDDEELTTGPGLPQGIYMGQDIAAADIAADDVEDNQMLIAGAFFDANQLVVEGGLDLDTILDTGTVNARVVGDALKAISLYPEDTVNISSFEN